MLLELLLELDDMFQDEFLLGGVLSIGDSRSLLLFELSAALELLVDDVLPPLEELQQLVVHLSLHLKTMQNVTEIRSSV